MPSYETLDLLADAYIPLLTILSLSLIVLSLFKSRWQVAGLQVLAITFVLLISYGLMFLDNRFQIWPAFGLDYSTHTAVSLSLVVFLSFNKPNRIIIWVGSFIAYLLLMLYQRYHTFSDIASTSAVVLVPVWLVQAFIYRSWPFAAKADISSTRIDGH
jgi:hypothetical protein